SSSIRVARWWCPCSPTRTGATSSSWRGRSGGSRSGWWRNGNESGGWWIVARGPIHDPPSTIHQQGAPRMPVWLIPISLFWILAAVYLGGFNISIIGGGG